MNVVSKILTVVVIFSMINSGVNAQVIANGTDSVQEATIDDLDVKPMRLPALQEVGGSPFMTADYKPGNIRINNEKAVYDVPVKFNIYSNAIMLQKDGEEMKLESFKLVSYEETGSDGTTKQIQFIQGLPETDNHTTKSVYQVLATGPKVQLVKYLSQKVEDAATLGDYSRKEIVTTEQLYIYIPGGEIKKIKSGKKDLAEALPSMSAKIDEIISAKNLKLKNESDITILIEALNKP